MQTLTWCRPHGWVSNIEEKLATLFDHLADDDLVVRDPGDAGAAEARFEAVADYYENRQRAQTREPGSYRPLAPATLYLAREEWEALVAARPMHLVTPFHEPDAKAVVDFGMAAARDFAPERAQGANVYEAVVAHLVGAEEPAAA